MASAAEWIEGIRVRTLPAATSPVLAGTGVAWFAGGFQPLLAALSLVVALAIQIGSNLANDFSDGIRGTDAHRVGPQRLVGSGAATPHQVLGAALGFFGLACAVGVVVAWLIGAWWLLAVGAACIVAAWFYTGGKRPYGYHGLGEIFVFVFYGLVAVIGTVYVQVGALGPAAWWTAVAIGALTVLILIANNLRDIDGDREAGKLTLATRLGDARTRWFFVGTTVVAFAGVFIVALTSTWWALLGWVGVAMLVHPAWQVARGLKGFPLVGVLKRTGIGELVCAVGLLVGLVIGS